MITKNECMSILVDLEDRGVNIDSQMKILIRSKEVPLEVLKFIAEYKGFDAANFYEILRVKHNETKSKLYTNLVRESNNLEEVPVILSSLLTQIFLFANKNAVSDKFLTSVRADEITRALNLFTSSNDLSICLKMLKLIRSDLLVFEFLAGRRELTN